MKAIINGRIYNTDTADFVCEISRGTNGSSFDWHATDLYRTRKGAFFLAGQGGPRSIWATQDGNCRSSGKGLRVITVEEARAFMEDAKCDADVYEEFGLPLTEG